MCGRASERATAEPPAHLQRGRTARLPARRGVGSLGRLPRYGGHRQQRLAAWCPDGRGHARVGAGGPRGAVGAAAALAPELARSAREPARSRRLEEDALMAKALNTIAAVPGGARRVAGLNARRLVNAARMAGGLDRPAVGCTPYDVVWRQDRVSLRRYRAGADPGRPAVLLVP